MSAPQGIMQPAVKNLKHGGTTTQRKGGKNAGDVGHGGEDAQGGAMGGPAARQNGVPSGKRVAKGGTKGGSEGGNVGRGGVDSRAPQSSRARQSGVPQGIEGGRPSSYKAGYKATKMERALRGKSF